MNPDDRSKMVGIMKATCLHAYLATCEGDQPQVRPVSPIVEDNGLIWVTAFRGSRKVKQITKNPKVCLAFVSQPSGDQAAIVCGKAEIVEDAKLRNHVWNLAEFNLQEYFPDGPDSADYCLLRIRAGKIEWRESWTSQTKVYEPTAI